MKKPRLHERFALARFERRRQAGRLLRMPPFDFDAFLTRMFASDWGRTHVADNVNANNALLARLKAKAA